MGPDKHCYLFGLVIVTLKSSLSSNRHAAAAVVGASLYYFQFWLHKVTCVLGHSAYKLMVPEIILIDDTVVAFIVVVHLVPLMARSNQAIHQYQMIMRIRYFIIIIKARLIMHMLLAMYSATSSSGHVWNVES